METLTYIYDQAKGKTSLPTNFDAKKVSLADPHRSDEGQCSGRWRYEGKRQVWVVKTWKIYGVAVFEKDPTKPGRSVRGQLPPEVKASLAAIEQVRTEFIVAAAVARDLLHAKIFCYEDTRTIQNKRTLYFKQAYNKETGAALKPVLQLKLPVRYDRANKCTVLDGKVTVKDASSQRRDLAFVDALSNVIGDVAICPEDFYRLPKGDWGEPLKILTLNVKEESGYEIEDDSGAGAAVAGVGGPVGGGIAGPGVANAAATFAGPMAGTAATVAAGDIVPPGVNKRGREDEAEGQPPLKKD
jgi:hypothetical protein